MDKLVTQDLVAREEQKRDRHWQPCQRWQAVMAAIAFADAQQPESRNSKRRCLELQREKLGR